MIGPDLALVEQSSRGANLHALAAARARRTSPTIVKICDDDGVDSAAHHVPHVRAFHLGAYAHAARAQNAAIVVGGEAFVRGVHRKRRIAIGQPHVREPLVLRQRLQLAVAVGYAHGADVVALGEQQFEDHPAVLLQALGIGGHLHALVNGGHAGRKQLVAALHLHNAEAASAHVRQPFNMTERRNVDPVFAGHIEDRLPARGAYFLAVDHKSFYFRGIAHAITSTAGSTAPASMVQTPAGQRLCTMCSMYSSRKYLSVLSTGLGAVWPSPHRLVLFTVSQSCSSMSRSSSVAVPLQIRVSRVCICAVPARHGMHLPHDSVIQNSTKKRATLTMQEVSSMTIMPPEPMIDPAAISAS